MAPYPINSSLEDDFVLTISDNDENLPVYESDEEILAIQQPYLKTKNTTKRNRDLDDNESPTENTAKSRKKRKASSATAHQVTNGSSKPRYEDQTSTTQGEDDEAMNPDFEFIVKDFNNGVIEDIDVWGLYGKPKSSVQHENNKGVDIDELIARRRKSIENEKTNGAGGLMVDKPNATEDSLSGDSASDGEGILEEHEDETMAEDGFGMGVSTGDEESDDVEGTEDHHEVLSDSDDSSIAEPVPHPHDDVSDPHLVDDSDDLEESARREAFFAPEENNISSASTIASSKSFQGMSLSRPILRGIASVGFSEPTPIQKKTIPIALLGKDVVGGAVTGSGKTGAFIIPILERLLYRPRKIPTSRVVILMPTRELAVQCFQVATKLAGFTDITFCQMVGGFSLREQEKVLRGRPDVIIATPGRFIDHMRNSASFTVDTLEIMVLDEADRMLEDGFADELNEILTAIPKSRQTMLFSATMTDQVDKLIRVGLNRPVRLMVDAKKQTVGTLVQEFVRLRPGREDKRLGYLLHLCENVYTEKVIIFLRQKKEAHRVRIIFGLCGLKATELHGNMTQEQRSASLSSFRASQSTHLLATDLAARGLDIPSVSCVLNYEAPQSPTIYLHRVGRTARAGRSGRACTLAAEPDRKVVKQVVRMAKAQGAKVVSRVIETKLADEWAEKVGALEEEVEAILAMEKEERAMGEAEREATRGENKIAFEEEIKARPKRTWFENEKEKKEAKEMGARELNGGGKGNGKLSTKAKKRLDDHRERIEGRIWKKGKENTVDKMGKGPKKVKGMGKGKREKSKKVDSKVKFKPGMGKGKSRARNGA